MTSDLDKQIKCVAREIALRRAVYPKFIKVKRMKQSAADDEIATMEQVLETLKRVKEHSQKNGW